MENMISDVELQSSKTIRFHNKYDKQNLKCCASFMFQLLLPTIGTGLGQ
jgi:hypothetical protein